MRSVAPAIVVASLLFVRSVFGAEARIELDLGTEPGFPVTGAQKWYQSLTEAGVNGLRIRSARATDKAALVVSGTKDSPVYKVSGLLTARNTLVVPGQQFSLNDRAGLMKWLKELREAGPQEEGKAAFGLTADELQSVLEDLRQPVSGTTQGVPPADVIAEAAKRLAGRVQVDPELSRLLAEEEAVRDELQGLSCGTALAALLRPAGAILQPRKGTDGAIGYRLTVAGERSESWPIGWDANKPERDVLPVLFEFLNVEISGITCKEALAAIQPRLKVPLLFDHNGMAQHRIDIAEVEVSMPGKRSYYYKILRTVLAPAHLKFEVRLDEADKPFLWISPLKRTD